MLSISGTFGSIGGNASSVIENLSLELKGSHPITETQKGSPGTSIDLNHPPSLEIFSQLHSFRGALYLFNLRAYFSILNRFHMLNDTARQKVPVKSKKKSKIHNGMVMKRTSQCHCEAFFAEAIPFFDLNSKMRLLRFARNDRSIGFFGNLLVLLVLVLIVGCAGQVPPGGGPPDTTPPSVVKTIPDSNATRIEDNSIELEFSEYVDRRSVEESIFISPYVGNLEFDWGTTDVKVNFSQQLKKNTTYVVNIGTDVVDTRARNRMAAGYTLAFSTGDSIDRGLISGRVFDAKPEGVMIFAYGLNNYNPDTLDPSTAKPDYIMQTGKNGLFALANLAFGRYRVIAVRDEFRNLLYEKQTDQFGVTVGDTVVSNEQPAVTDLWFRLSQEDTTKPFLTSVQPLANRHVQIRFSEPLDSVRFGNASFTIIDTLKLKSVPIVLCNLSRVTPSVVELITETRLDSGGVYRVRGEGMFDRAGNLMDSSHASLDFVGVGNPDTVRVLPNIRGVIDSVRGIALEQIFEIGFSKPVLHQPLNNSITLRDSTKTVLPSGLRWLNASDVQLVPVEPLQSNAWYQIRVVLDSVQDYFENRWKDSTWSVVFQSLDLRTTGTIEGVVVDEAKERGRGLIYITVASVDANPERGKILQLSKTGSFSVDRLPEGKYTFSGFRDADSSGSYSFGQPFPFVPSERFTVSSDTVKVRARWGVEGVVLKFK
jgi:hypothetical protein